MKKSRFTEEKIIEILKGLESGRKVSDLSREYGVSTASIYAWKSRYAGPEVSELKRLKELKEENRRLKTFGHETASQQAVPERPRHHRRHGTFRGPVRHVLDVLRVPASNTRRPTPWQLRSPDDSATSRPVLATPSSWCRSAVTSLGPTRPSSAMRRFRNSADE